MALPSVVHGYVLPSHYVIKKAQALLDKSRGLQVGFLGRAWTAEKRQSINVGERWLFGPKTQVDVTDSHGRTATWNMNRTSSGELSLLPPPAVLFAISGLFGGASLSQHLAGLGILASPRRLQLLDGEVAISMGAETDQLNLPQAWFDQETFQPVRLIFRSDKSLYDLRMTDWSSPRTRGLFPRRLEIRRDGRPLRELSVSTLRHPKGPR